jgi:hypothetical protein
MFRGEEYGCLGHFFGTAEPAKGNFFKESFRCIPILEVMGHIRFNKTGGDGIAPDIPAAQFMSGGLGKANDTGFAGGITGLAGIAPDPDDGTHIDD